MRPSARRMPEPSGDASGPGAVAGSLEREGGPHGREKGILGDIWGRGIYW